MWVRPRPVAHLRGAHLTHLCVWIFPKPPHIASSFDMLIVLFAYYQYFFLLSFLKPTKPCWLHHHACHKSSCTTNLYKQFFHSINIFSFYPTDYIIMHVTNPSACINVTEPAAMHSQLTHARVPISLTPLTLLDRWGIYTLSSHISPFNLI